ncbi:hypothetical protein [Mycoplasma miroungirhinis]|uniref:Uncharacterized protein n=1 Tax=Mycoplasma miroungirhinis TaxID=754516 RepID=A0A6M4JBD7_9MOLU|nr:hypothetical protein [Mycoplasma miroungirhinis]QJR44323.1 hypothetical protein HLA92_02695 [Mycoplasma miroungirhinis]
MKSVKKTLFYYRVIMPLLWIGIFLIWIVLYFKSSFVETTFSTAMTPFLVLFLWICYKMLKLTKYKRTLEMYYIQKLYHKKNNKILAWYVKLLIGWYEYDKCITAINNYQPLKQIIDNYSKYTKQEDYFLTKKLDDNYIENSLYKSKIIYKTCIILSWIFLIIPFLYLALVITVFGFIAPLEETITRTNKPYNYIMHWVIPSLMIVVLVVKKILAKYIFRKYYLLYIYSVYTKEDQKYLLHLWRFKNDEFLFFVQNIKLNLTTKTLAGEIYIFNKKITL